MDNPLEPGSSLFHAVLDAGDFELGGADAGADAGAGASAGAGADADADAGAVQVLVQLPPQGVTTTFTRSDKLRKNEALAVVRHFAEQFGINLASPYKSGQTLTMAKEAIASAWPKDVTCVTVLVFR